MAILGKQEIMARLKNGEKIKYQKGYSTTIPSKLRLGDDTVRYDTFRKLFNSKTIINDGKDEYKNSLYSLAPSHRQERD